MKQRKCCNTPIGSGPHADGCPNGRDDREQISGGRRKGHCFVCGDELGIPGGMAGTGLCGPCCTGEADTIDEFGDTW